MAETTTNFFQRLAVNYLFLSTDGGDDQSVLTVDPFNAADEQNDYEVRSYHLGNLALYLADLGIS